MLFIIVIGIVIIVVVHEINYLLNYFCQAPDARTKKADAQVWLCLWGISYQFLIKIGTCIGSLVSSLKN